MMNLDEAIQHCEEVAEMNERICDTEPSIGLPNIYKHKDEAKKCASEHRQLAEWLKELKAYREQGGDAVSRQAAIDAVGLCRVPSHIKKRIAELPSVTPQQRMGHWIFDEILDKHYYCSECKSMGVDYWDYCPNCGAKMEVEEC